MSRRLFVTGTPRSGTTLLDKLLSAHPEIRVHSQPLPLLYVEVKRAFLASRGGVAAGCYPLNDMFRESYYPPPELRTFLDSFELDHRFCRRVLTEMLSFSGQGVRPQEPFRVLDGYRPAVLYEFVDRYLSTLAPLRRWAVVGSKEVFCEEYVPYLLSRGSRVLQVLRDPRDVVTSLDHGRGELYTGRRKPHLWNVRQWRKSVAFALAHKDHPGFLAVRYEDLVREPLEVLSEIAAFLGVGEFEPDMGVRELRSPSGELWSSNSSHSSSARITARSVGSYRRHLAREVDRFIQATCLAEMRRLGYELGIGVDDVVPVLESYRESAPPARPELAGYAWSPERCAEEQQRLKRLREGSFEAPLFLFEKAFAELAERLAEEGGS